MNCAPIHTVTLCQAPVMGAGTPAVATLAFAQRDTLSLAERPAP